ncbi:MAG: hypothetical protein ACT4OM_03900 [Actinomycetota bacterium]
MLAYETDATKPVSPVRLRLAGIGLACGIFVVGACGGDSGTRSAGTPRERAEAIVNPIPADPGFDPKRYIQHGDAYSCLEFASQADAQAVLRADPSDPNKLDDDGDGIACPDQPEPEDRTPVVGNT